MKLKRLVSAVLAVGMALTMLPTAAFAADTSTPTAPIKITNLKFNEDGLPIIPNPGNDYTYEENGKQQYRVTNTDHYVVIYPEHMFTGSTDQIIRAYVRAEGILNGGIYAGGVAVQGGSIQNGLFNCSVNLTQNGTISGGVFAKDVTVAEKRTLTAAECKIYTAESLQISKDAYIPDMAYIVGDQKMVLTLQSLTLTGWKVNGVELDMKNPTNTVLRNVSISLDENDVNTLAFTMPQENVIIEPVVTSVEFKLGANGMPEYKGKKYLGNSQLDGWQLTVKNTSSNLSVEQGSTVNLENNSVDWSVTNNGTLENGTIDNTITNYGTVKDITATWYFNNYGTIESGVFSRMANFGEQNPSVRWVSVNGGTVNGMSVAGIVGEQTVTVKADTGFKCWSVSGDTDFALTEEQKYNPELTLTLNGEDKGNIILTAQTEEGYYRLNLTDGKAYSATADGAKDQEINAAKPGDTVILEADASLIPDGMVFDRWEVTGDTELTGNFDAKAEKTSFTMPKSEVTLRAMYRMADQPEEPNVLGTVAMVATAGVGAAVVGYTGYMIGTELYLNTVLPEGTAIPNNATELAVLVWNDAGKPAPAAVLAADATDEQKALTWAVENQLISADKAADASVGRWEVIDAWNKAQELKKV